MRVLADEDLKAAIIICSNAQNVDENMDMIRREIKDIKKDPDGTSRD